MAPVKVTVVMIFFNAEGFIAEALSSVMNQDMHDFELLLCDDGSTDESSALAKDLARKHPNKVRYLEHPGHINRGMSATRNLGLRAARGEYVACIDSDDVWSRTKLGDQVALMEAMPELGMVCGAVRYWWSWNGGQDEIVPTGHRQDVVVRPPDASLALYPLGTAAAPCPSDALLRRVAVEHVGLFEEHFTGPRQAYEDQGFFAKLYLMWPVYFSSQIWLDYRQHAGSIVATVKREGEYDVVRSYFLTWFQGYVADQPDVARSVHKAITRALRPYRRPKLHRLMSLPMKAMAPVLRSRSRHGGLRRSKRSFISRASSKWHASTQSRPH